MALKFFFVKCTVLECVSVGGCVCVCAFACERERERERERGTEKRVESKSVGESFY